MDKNKTLPLVSILMVVYNSSEFLKEAVESVLSCEYPTIELIICDDCSSDNSAQLIESFEDKRIRFYKNKTNIGEYPNRNKAMSLAKGKYFVFVDGDDLLLKNGLDNAVFQMEKHSNTAFGVFVNEGVIEKHLETFLPIATYRQIYFKQNILSNSFAGNIFRTQTVRTNFEGFTTNLYSGDYLIRASLAIHHAIAIIHQPFANWRTRPNQASAQKKKSVSGLVEPYLLRIHFLYHPKNPLSDIEKTDARKILITKQRKHLFSAIKKGQIKLAIAICKSMKYHFESKKGIEISQIKK